MAAIQGQRGPRGGRCGGSAPDKYKAQAAADREESTQADIEQKIEPKVENKTKLEKDDDRESAEKAALAALKLREEQKKTKNGKNHTKGEADSESEEGPGLAELRRPAAGRGVGTLKRPAAAPPDQPLLKPPALASAMVKNEAPTFSKAQVLNASGKASFDSSAYHKARKEAKLLGFDEAGQTYAAKHAYKAASAACAKHGVS